jgi:hypothetical protein
VEERKQRGGRGRVTKDEDENENGEEADRTTNVVLVVFPFGPRPDDGRRARGVDDLIM